MLCGSIGFALALIDPKKPPSYSIRSACRQSISSAFPTSCQADSDSASRSRVRLLLDPKILICDEPVSALDVSIQAQIINLLKMLQASMGIAYVFISHNLSLVRHISDRIAVMYLGQIVEIGDTQVLNKMFLHPYSRALFDATPKIGSAPRARRAADRRGPEPAQSAVRLPFPDTVSACGRALRGGGARTADRSRSGGALSFC